MRLVLGFLMLAIPLTGHSRATTYTVDPYGTGDFPTIQQPIYGAVDGDVVQLTDGVFTGSGNREINFLGKAVMLCSVSGIPETCMIDCQSISQGLILINGSRGTL